MAKVAAQLGDRSRMAIVLHLMDGESRTSSELALAANLSAPSTSMHLAKLVRAGILSVNQHGRNKYFRIAGAEVAHAVEAISAAVRYRPSQPAWGRRAQLLNPWAFARTCYDHLAGRLGVELALALERLQYLRPDSRGSYVVTPEGRARLQDLGIDCERLAKGRRALATPCLDWTEQRHHIGGALGAALLDQTCNLGWVARSRIPRLLRLTHKGEAELKRRFSLTFNRR